METKRLVLAFALSAAVLIGWTVLFPPPKPSAPAARPAAATPAATATASSTTTATAGTQTPVPPPAGRPARESVVPVSAGAEEMVEVRSPLFTARLSNEGGALKSLRPDASPGRRREGARPRAAGAAVSGRDAHPRSGGSLPSTGPEGALRRGEGVRERRDLGALSIPRGGGEGLVRSYVFRDSYVVAVKAEREGAPGAPVGLVLGPRIGNPSQEELSSRYTKPGATVTLSASASVDRKAKDSLKEPLPKGAGLVAAGIEDNYFLTAFLPSGPAAVTLRPVALAAAPRPKAKPRPRERHCRPRPRAKSSCRRRTPSRRTCSSAEGARRPRDDAPAWTASSMTAGTRSS